MLQLLHNTYVVIGYKLMYVHIKPASTTTPYPLGYKYNYEMMYSRVKLPTKVFTKNGSGVLQTMEFKNENY